METKFIAYLEPSKQLTPSTINILINTVKNLSIPFSPYKESKFFIEQVLKENNYKEDSFNNIEGKNIFGLNNIQSFLKKNLLKITCTIQLPNVIPQSLTSNWTAEEVDFYREMSPDDFNLSYSYDLMKKRVQDLIFAFNLSNNGIISISRYLIFQDDNKNIMAGKNLNYNIFSTALTKIQTWNYPKVKVLDFEKTWNWLIKFDDFLEGYSQSSTTRALLNLFEIPKVDENMKLFRAVMGIESLYTEGNNSLMKQVKEKSQIILGEQEAFKSLYDKMYKLRSKYIHGELDFISSVYTSTKFSINHFNKTLEEATSFAILILYASIQKLIENNWKGFEFTSHWEVKGEI